MKKADTLKEIVIKKKERLLLARQNLPEEELKNKVSALAPTRPFLEAINKPRVISLVAEIKKGSPSKGIIRQDFNYLEIARAYEACGVAAISVLTEEDYFLGSVSFINEIKAATKAPILRKDFIFEPYQVYESRFYGADAILLIADLLSKEKLQELIELAAVLGLGCLVEAHTDKELKKILGLKTCAFAVGINNRNLHTLEVDLKTTEKLYPMVPKARVVVVESGIKSRQDVLFLKILGVNAVLIGEAFMESENIQQRVEEIMVW